MGKLLAVLRLLSRRVCIDRANNRPSSGGLAWNPVLCDSRDSCVHDLRRRVHTRAALHPVLPERDILLCFLSAHRITTKPDYFCSLLYRQPSLQGSGCHTSVLPCCSVGVTTGEPPRHSQVSHSIFFDSWDLSDFCRRLPSRRRT